MRTEYFTFALGLLTILAALRRSRQAIKFYFIAQLVSTLTIFPAYLWLGNHHVLYRLLYIAVTLPILETCCFVIAGMQRNTLMLAASYGAIMGGIAINGLKELTPDSAVCLGQGILLSTIGLAMLLVAPEAEDRCAVRTIGMFSLALACFSFAYILNSWEAENKWLPSFLGITAFGWIALSPQKMRSGHSQN
jgi:hypothetical protein